MADERRAEQTSFRNQMSAFQDGKDMRQTRREAIQDVVESLQQKIQSLQQELQDLDGEDAADDNKAMQLQSEYRVMTEQWRRTQKTLENRILAAVSEMVRLHLRSLAALISV